MTSFVKYIRKTKLLWNEPYEFDDLAFKNAVYREIKIKEVKRVR